MKYIEFFRMSLCHSNKSDWRSTTNYCDLVSSPARFFLITVMDGRPFQHHPMNYRGVQATPETSNLTSSLYESNFNGEIGNARNKKSETGLSGSELLSDSKCELGKDGDDGYVRVRQAMTSNVLNHKSRTNTLKAFMDLKIVFLAILLLAHGIRCLDNNILQLNIPTEEPVIDPNTVCKTFPDLSPKQYRLCAKYPDVTASAIQGVQIAVHECQHQLKEHRWNCSSLEKRNKNPHSSPLLKKGYKETAFAYALSSAGVTYQVSKACSMGKLKSCGCDMSMQGEVRDKFEWGGCSHNVEFGEKFAKKFTTARETARDIHAKINLHNNRAGRLTILKNVRRQCKCHGMSGSCEIKTCWKVSPDFRLVGSILKERYHAASKVHISNKADGRSKRRLVRKQANMQLVYYESSPNFCEANRSFDSPGTMGRYCNKSASGYGNCDTLCCGRGYNTLKVRRSERCNCKFHWCCYVVCQTCTFNEWVTVCK